jgi:DNA-binding transcriptional regulator YiaG
MKGHKTETRIFKGLGFPIKLVDVPMRKMLGEWVMDIDFTALQLVALRALIYKPAPLTKDELKFIRKFLAMTTTAFGKVFGVTHVAVLQWENGKRNLSPSLELCLRLYILNHLHAKDKEFRSLYSKISLAELSKKRSEKIVPLEINVAEDLKIA